jgi:menaquinone-dependent protoporphyrinogen IX oxidase
VGERPAKGVLIGLQTAENLRQSYLVGGVFLNGKHFDSIVIVVPVQVSKFYRVLKRFTASFQSAFSFENRFFS